MLGRRNIVTKLFYCQVKRLVFVVCYEVGKYLGKTDLTPFHFWQFIVKNTHHGSPVKAGKWNVVCGHFDAFYTRIISAPQPTRSAGPFGQLVMFKQTAFESRCFFQTSIVYEQTIAFQLLDAAVWPRSSSAALLNLAPCCGFLQYATAALVMSLGAAAINTLLWNVLFDFPFSMASSGILCVLWLEKPGECF